VKSILTVLYVNPEHPIDPITDAVLREIDSLANKLGLPYFVAGAMARDIVLTNVFGLTTGRATRDVDFAIAVENWEQFETVKNQLVASGRFESANKQTQRLYYKAANGKGGYPVDIIPFRGVENPHNKIAWPPDTDMIMNVVGYEEALATSIRVQVQQEFVIHVASLPGLALLKLFAWADRGNENPKDAQDLVILMRGYAAAGNHDRLYGDAIDMMEAVNFDLDLAGPRLLGRDTRNIASQTTLEQLDGLLGNNATAERLITDMAREMRTFDNPLDQAERLLEQFKAGLNKV
jgi:predicted nucleotidyltransferase